MYGRMHARAIGHARNVNVCMDVCMYARTLMRKRVPGQWRICIDRRRFLLKLSQLQVHIRGRGIGLRPAFFF